MSVFGNALAIVITLAVGYLIFKKYKPQPVLLAAGLILLLAAELLGVKTILAEDKTTGFILFDAFTYLKNTMSSSVSGTGLIIMTVGGYASYMNHIGASDAMVRICIKPLKKIGSPYLVLAMAYVVGQILNIFIPSAAGLAVLLLATMYPILIALGVSKLSAASVIATTACLDLGPASGTSNVASETAALSAMEYFLKYQMALAIPVIIVITVLHFIINRNADKKMGHVVAQAEMTAKVEDKKTPAIYALLPVIPLALLMIFNQFVISTISIEVIAAMMIGFAVSIFMEIAVRRDVKAVCKGTGSFFDGMGKQLSATVSLIIAADLFSKGLQAIGLINTIINAAQNVGFGAAPMTVIMVIIISATAFVTGSGVAAFTSFAALAPVVAEAFGAHPVVLLVAMQLAAGLARSFSPVASCLIAPAAYADVSPMDVVRRTMIPMIAGIVVLLAADFIFFL